MEIGGGNSGTSADFELWSLAAGNDVLFLSVYRMKRFTVSLQKPGTNYLLSTYYRPSSSRPTAALSQQSRLQKLYGGQGCTWLTQSEGHATDFSS